MEHYEGRRALVVDRCQSASSSEQRRSGSGCARRGGQAAGVSVSGRLRGAASQRLRRLLLLAPPVSAGGMEETSSFSSVIRLQPLHTSAVLSSTTTTVPPHGGAQQCSGLWAGEGAAPHWRHRPLPLAGVSISPARRSCGPLPRGPQCCGRCSVTQWTEWTGWTEALRGEGKRLCTPPRHEMTSGYPACRIELSETQLSAVRDLPI